MTSLFNRGPDEVQRGRPIQGTANKILQVSQGGETQFSDRYMTEKPFIIDRRFPT